MKRKTICLDYFDQAKLKKFFNPGINEVQHYFMNQPNVVNFLISMGYEPNSNTKKNEDGTWDMEMVYFSIPEQFRYKKIMVEKEVRW